MLTSVRINLTYRDIFSVSNVDADLKILYTLE